MILNTFFCKQKPRISRCRPAPFGSRFGQPCRGCLYLLFFLLLTGYSVPVTRADAGIPPRPALVASEHQLKAVFLFNFLQFTQWPEAKCGPVARRPLEIAILGQIPFHEALRSLQAQLELKDHPPLSIKVYGPYTEEMDLSGCRLLFVSSSEKKNFGRIIEKLKDEPVLTVADDDNFLQAGGMITLLNQENKIRWAINRKSVQRAGLRLSAKLFDIAVRVVEEP